jgi:proline racemase
MSNWTAAALVVGTGATTLALAHHAFPIGAPTAAVASSSTGAVTAAATQGTNGPQVSHTVATTSASGVTVTTTSHVVNGKTVVSHVRHVPAYHDS